MTDNRDLQHLQEQNRAILQALNTQSQALALLMKNFAKNDFKPQSLHNLQFETFDEQKETFKSYKGKLENFFELKKLKGDSPETNTRAKVLINALGAKYYELLSSLTAPDLPSTKTYDYLIKLLEKHLCPQTNVHTERHKFLSRTQQTNETISQYLAALKQLSKTSQWNCEIQTCNKPINIILQAQFIRGLKDTEIREQILQQGDEINLEKAVEISLAIETAKRQNQIYTNNAPNVSDIHKILKYTTRQSSETYIIMKMLSTACSVALKRCDVEKEKADLLRKAQASEGGGLRVESEPEDHDVDAASDSGIKSEDNMVYETEDFYVEENIEIGPTVVQPRHPVVAKPKIWCCGSYQKPQGPRPNRR